MISAPFSRRSRAVMPFTAPCVPTGMNAGVCTTPCAVVISPRRAAPARAIRRNANALTIGYIMVANRAARHDPDQEPRRGSPWRGAAGSGPRFPNPDIHGRLRARETTAYWRHLWRAIRRARDLDRLGVGRH